jgi:hypothetical protein
VDAIGPVAGQAAASHKQQVVDDAADRQALMHGDQTRHGFAASNALEGVPRHGRDVVSQKNATFLRCPSENVRIRSASAPCVSDSHDVHVGKTSAQSAYHVVVKSSSAAKRIIAPRLVEPAIVPAYRQEGNALQCWPLSRHRRGPVQPSRSRRCRGGEACRQ